MAQKTAFGLKAVPLRKGNMIANVKRMMSNYIKVHTEEGEVVDPNVYYEAINMGLPFSGELTIDNTIAGYKNQAEKLKAKIKSAENNKAIFDFELGNAIVEATQQNYSDPRGLFFKLAELYGTALDDYDEKVMTPAFESIPKGSPMPENLLNYRDSLKIASRQLINLSNSYLTEDPETELLGPSVPDAYGVLIQTSSQTGAIVNIGVKEVGSLEGVTGYKKTNVRYGRIPIYLNTYAIGGDEFANLGGVIFEYDLDDELLKKEEDFLGFAGGIKRLTERLIGAIGKETRKGIGQEQDEFPLSSVQFDFFAIPPEVVVKDFKGSYYFYDKNSLLWKAESPEMLKKYLKEIGKNPSDVDDNFYLGHIDFIQSRTNYTEEGKERIINEEMFGSNLKQPEKKVSAPVVSKLSPSVAPPETPRIPTAQPKAEERKVLGPVQVQEASEFERFTGYKIPKIFEKGREIFQKFIRG